MKRSLSLILAVAMLIGLLPTISFTAAAEEAPKAIVYDFTVSAVSDESIIAVDGKGTKSVQFEKVTETSQLDASVSSGLWTFVAKPGFKSGALYADCIQARVDPANIGKNGIVLKTSFPADATYAATINYVKNAANGRTNVYFVPAATATEKGWDMATADGINGAIADSANSGSTVGFAGSVDMHANSTDANPFEGNTFDVKKGEYYIILNVSDDSVKGESDKYFSMITNISLKKEEKREAVESPKYNFTCTAFGQTTTFSAPLSLDYAFDSSVSTGVYSWVSNVNIKTANFMAGHVSFYTANYTPNKDNALVFKLTLDTDGTYVPTIDYDKNAYQGLLDMYLIKKDYAAEKGWNVFSNSTIATKIAEFDAESSMTNPDAKVLHVASVDQNSNASANATNKIAEKLNLTAGEYYLYLVISKGECENTVHNNARMYGDLKHLTLTKQAGGNEGGNPPAPSTGAKTLKYEFTLAGSGEDLSEITETNALLNSKRKLITAGDGNTDAEPGDDWTYLGMSGNYTNTADMRYITQLLENGIWGYAASNSYNVIGLNAIGFKINVPADGTYTPKVNYLPQNGMGKLYAYIIDDAVNGKAHTNYTGNSKTWDFETSPANSLSYAMQTLRTDNTYGMPEEMKLAVSGEDTNLVSYPTEIRTFTGEPMALTAGTYYIIFSQDCSSRRYTYINSFELEVPGSDEEEEPELSGKTASYTYTFTKTGRSDTNAEYLEKANGSWHGDYKSFPASPANFGDMWAYAGSTHGKAATKTHMVTMSETYAGTGQTATEGQWLAFRIKAPYTTKYLISGAKAFTYQTASKDVDIYIAPMDEAMFSEGGSIYGTVAIPEGEEYARRTNGKTFEELALSDSTLIGHLSMFANRKGSDAVASENKGVDAVDVSKKAIFELEKNKEYVIFFVNKTLDSAVTPNSLTITYEIPPIPDLDTITATFAENETVLIGSKLSPSVKYYGEGDELKADGATVSVDIIENSSGALIKTDSGDIFAKQPGSATLRVSGTLDGVTKTVDVTVTVMVDDTFSGVSTTYKFYQSAYGDGNYSVTVQGATNGDVISEEDFKKSVAVEYSAKRPWAMVSTVASQPSSKSAYFGQNASYMDLSLAKGEWTAFKVKVPAPGKYTIDMAAYTYKNAGLAEMYMTPYTEDMTFGYVKENIDSITTAENLVASADFNDSSKSAAENQANVGTFIADANLDYSAGYTEYLMVIKSAASKINSSKYSVLLYTIDLIGGGGISALETKVNYTTIATGESLKVTDVVAKNAGGSEIDLSDAFVSHSVAEGSEGILKLNDDGVSFTALAPGKAKIKTLVLMEGSSETTEVEITVDDNVGVKNVYLYAPSVLQAGKVADLVTRLELNNSKLVADGEIVGIEIVDESEPGVVSLSADGKSLSAKKEGTASVKARVLARGKVFETDTIVIAVSGVEMNYASTFTIDLRKGAYQGDSSSSLFELTNYTSTRNWIFHKVSGINSSYPGIDLASSSANFAQIVFNGVKETNYLAFKVIFPVTGNYTVDVTGYCRDRAAKLDLFVIPATEENMARLDSLLDVNGEYYFGSADTYRPTASAGVKNTFGTDAITSAGEYVVVFRTAEGQAKAGNKSYGDAWYPLYIDFVNASSLYRADLVAEEDKTSIEISETLHLNPVLYGGDGSNLVYDDSVEVIWKSSDENIATVNATGKVRGVNEGKAEITAIITKDGATVVSKLLVSVFDNSGIDMNENIKIKYDSNIYAYGATKIELSVLMNSGRWVTVPSEFVTYRVTSGSQFVSVSEDGTVTGLDEGSAVVSLSIDPSWKDGIENLSVPAASINVVWDMNVKPAVFSLRERENAKINASRYDWARDEVSAAKAKADQYLDMVDMIYDRIVPEGLPRYYHIGHKYDPLKFYCRYCGCNVGLEYGSYAWKANAIQSPWKVQCPDCLRKFPSNDFESFYKLGLSDDRAHWNYDEALMRHHELFVCQNLDENGKCTCENVPHPTNDRMSEAWKAFYGFGIGYLANTLYPEMDEKLGVVGWGVDDSLGYKQPYISKEKAQEIAGPGGDINSVPGYYPTYYEKDGYAYYPDSTGGPVQYTYVAFYVHDGIWYGAGTSIPLAKTAIQALTDAFILTGEAKYGRAGAILLDRIADVYPGFEWYDWHEFRGDSYRGKEVDTVWSTGNATLWAEAVDAFSPMYNDPYVVNYLSSKAPRYAVDEKGNWIYDENGEKIPVNLKDSPGALRRHVEKNILDEIFYSVKNGKVIGNFGMHQKAVATAALAYNRLPETKEMLDWILAPGTNYNTGPQQEKEIAGGQILKNLIEEVNRDGIGNENAPGYNRGWITNLITVADLLAGYELYSEADLFENVKFTKMFLGIVRLTLGGYYGTQTGDSGATGSKGIVLQIDDSLIAYKHTRDRVLAQAMYLKNEESIEGLRGSILDDDPEQIAREIEQIIEEDGGLNLKSEMLTGYGFAALRDGADYDSVSESSRNNNTRDMAIYFGANTGHGHYDTLNLFMSAFGLNIAPDLGYPEQTGSQPNRMEWVDASISHNTVIVDERSHKNSGNAGIPYHFDDSGRVKLMDVAAPNVYTQTEEYRRTVFMVEANDDISYGVDFFHILGGNDHLYSFHSQSDEISVISGLDDVKETPMRTDENGSIYGVYAGEDVMYGPDPGGVGSGVYPNGYTWMRNVRTFQSIDKDFSVEYKVKDWNRALSTNRDIRLRLTMVNDEPFDEVTFTTALPPQTSNNKNVGELEYLLVRNKGSNIDTTFTTVFEPYEAGKKYIDSIEKVSMKRAEGTKPGLNDNYAAVKVTLDGGKRVDYVIYSTNNEVDYIVDGKIEFRGFGGVMSFEGDDVVYRYLNDGEVLKLRDEADYEEKFAAYTGEVVSFTKELTKKNFITIKLDNQGDLWVPDLAGKYVYVDNDKVENGAYKIISAEEDGENIVLSLEDVSIIRSFVDAFDMELGYVYNIKEGDKLRIPVTAKEDGSPVFEEVPDAAATVGSQIIIPIKVASPIDKEVTLVGTSLPRGMAIDTVGNNLIWTPSSSQTGDNHVAITATDGTLETTIHFTIKVYGKTTGGSGGGGDTGTTTQPEVKPEVKPEEPKQEGTTTPEKEETVTPSVPETADGFVDLGSHAWAAEAINALADEGIIKGTSETTFAPGNNITRADFAILLVRAFNKTSEETENFADVSDTDYFAKELAIARNTGLVGGIGDNKFAPKAFIKRSDMMLMVYRALKADGVEFEIKEPDFADFADVPDYAKEAVSALIGAGLVNGKGDRIAPNDNTTRAEVAVLVKRILDFTAEK